MLIFRSFLMKFLKGYIKDKGEPDEYYEIESVYDVLNKAYVAALMNHADWMVDKDGHYPYAKHHLRITEEVAKQLWKNAKIVEYSK